MRTALRVVFACSIVVSAMVILTAAAFAWPVLVYQVSTPVVPGFYAVSVPPSSVCSYVPHRVRYVTPPVRWGGAPSYHEINTWTGHVNQVIDVGLNAAGYPAVAMTNWTGGTTILKSQR